MTGRDAVRCEHKVQAVMRSATSKAGRCGICGRFTDKDGRCSKVFLVDQGIYEHA